MENEKPSKVERFCPKCSYSLYVGQTINCDGCEEGFHLECVEIARDKQEIIHLFTGMMTDKNTPFYCTCCVMANQFSML